MHPCGLAHELDHLVRSRDQRNVDETSLNLCPLIAGLTPQSRRVSLESLVKDADDDQLAGTTACRLGKLLEEIDVAAVLCRRLEQLSELVDDNQHPLRMTLSGFHQFTNNVGLFLAAWLQSVGLRKRGTELLNYISSPTHHRHDKPTVTLCFERLVDRAAFGNIQQLSRFRTHIRLRAHQRAKHQRERRLASAVRASPSKSTLSGFHNLPSHALKQGASGALADIARQSVIAPYVGVNTD